MSAMPKPHSDEELAPREGRTDDADRADEDCRRHREASLDEALEESFPASDTPSIAAPPCRDQARSRPRAGSSDSTSPSASTARTP